MATPSPRRPTALDTPHTMNPEPSTPERPDARNALQGAAWFALLDTRANMLKLVVRSACAYHELRPSLDDAYERLNEALAQAITWAELLREAHDPSKQDPPIQLPREALEATLCLEQTCDSLATIRACGWTPRREPAPSPPSPIQPDDEQITHLCDLKRHAQHLWTIETTYARIARIVDDAASRVLRPPGPWTVTIHPVQAAQPLHGREARLHAVIRHDTDGRSIATDEAQRLSDFLHANDLLASFEETITIAAGIDPRRWRYRVVFEQANIEHCDIDVLAPNRTAARQRAQWNHHSEQFSEWRTSHVAPDSLRAVDVVPLGLCETSEDDRLDNPPNGYRETIPFP